MLNHDNIKYLVFKKPSKGVREATQLVFPRFVVNLSIASFGGFLFAKEVIMYATQRSVDKLTKLELEGKKSILRTQAKVLELKQKVNEMEKVITYLMEKVCEQDT